MAAGAYKPVRGISWQEVGDEVVILDVKVGRYYGLNRTAAFVWICLVQPRKGTKTAGDYAAAFGVGDDVAARDFAALTKDLISRKWIEPRASSKS